VTTRVLLVDDEAIVRTGLRMILEAEDDLEVIGEAADGMQAVTTTAALRPDVVLMDVRMPGMDGLAAASRILSADPTVKVVMLTTFNEDDYVHRALRFGASGFLLKVAPPERLVETIRVAARGDALLDPLVTRKIIEAFATAAPRSIDRPPELNQLTARESEVLHMLARGMSNAEIAAALVVGDATIKTHVARILMKLGLRDRVQAVVYAYEHGLVHPGGPSAPPARS
jgi:DNA-binding NarL/FixJ family response regulator